MLIERPRDGDALLLAARELARMMIEPLEQPDLLEPVPRHLLRVSGTRAGVDERQHHLLQRRRSRQKIELLKHEADRAVSEIGEIVRRQRADIASVDR